MNYFVSLVNKKMKTGLIVFIGLFISLVGVTADVQSIQAKSLNEPLTPASNQGLSTDLNNIPPVNAVYHGVLPFNSFHEGTYSMDSWTYGDIAFYASPGRVTQQMANQYVAWYSHMDGLHRRVWNQPNFDSVYRKQDRNHGKKKVVAFIDKGRCSCGNKQQAEILGFTDWIVNDPTNWRLHWVMFYEMNRGGPTPNFYARTTWPNTHQGGLILPHMMAALAFYEIGGSAGLNHGNPKVTHDVPGDFLLKLVNWEKNSARPLLVNEKIPADIQMAILIRILQERGTDTFIQILHNMAAEDLSEKPHQALCDFRDAVNSATGNQYNANMTNKWRLPNDCGNSDKQPPAPAHKGAIQNVGSGKCLDIEGTSHSNGTNALQWDCHGGTNQQFQQVNGNGGFMLKVAHSDKCLDVWGGNIHQWACHGGDNQIFNWDGAQLRIKISGQCMTVRNGLSGNGANIQAENCTNSPAQHFSTGRVSSTPPPAPGPKWTCQQISDTRGTDHGVTWGSATKEEREWWAANHCRTRPSSPAPAEPAAAVTQYLLKNIGSGQCLDIAGYSQSNGGNALQWPCHGQSNQQIEEVQGKGGFMLKIAHSNKCLDVWGGNIYQWACHGGDHQLFNWDGNQLRIKSSGQCVTVQDDSTNNAANIQEENCSNSSGQQFSKVSAFSANSDVEPSIDLNSGQNIDSQQSYLPTLFGPQVSK